MSDSGSAITMGLGLVAVGFVVGFAGPRVVEKIITKMKPGGKFTGVSVY